MFVDLSDVDDIGSVEGVKGYSRVYETTNKTEKDRHDDGSVEDVKKDYSKVCAKTTTTTTTSRRHKVSEK